jgi:uncharacterized protein YaeQ
MLRNRIKAILASARGASAEDQPEAWQRAEDELVRLAEAEREREQERNER